MMAQLERALPTGVWQRLAAQPPEQQAASLLGDAVLGCTASVQTDLGSINACEAVAGYIIDAWKARPSTALDGRGLDGREPSG